MAIFVSFAQSIVFVQSRILFACSVRARKPRAEFLASKTYNAFDLHSKGTLNDVTVRFRDKEVGCNKQQLASSCEYFRRIFTSGPTVAKVDLKGISGCIGSQIVDYLYTGHIEITPSNAEDIVAASVLLQLESLKEEAEESLCTVKTEKTAFGLLNFAVKHGLESLRKQTLALLVSKIADMYKLDAFDELKRDFLKEIIALSQKDSSQEDLFRAVQKWTKVKKKGERISLSSCP
jgi:hypothetical protein